MSGGVVPVTVIGGYLGAGKTTLVNALLRGGHGLRIAVAVNDFGSVAVDRALLVARDEDTITLANGCVCCSLGAELAAGLVRLAARRPAPAHIVVEASGVSRPRNVAALAAAPSGMRPAGVVVLVDATTAAQRTVDRWVGDVVRAQVSDADLIVLTKTDLLDAEQETAAVDAVRSVAPGTQLVGAPHGDVAPDVVLRPRRGAERAGDRAAERTGRFRTRTWRLDDPVPAAVLRRAVRDLPAEVQRVKGIVRLADDEEHPYAVHRAGGRVTLERLAPTADDGVLGRLVVVATDDVPLPALDGLGEAEVR